MPDIKPVDRLQAFLARIAGNEEAPELTPRDQLEYYLAKMAERVDNIQPGGAGWQDGVPYDLVWNENGYINNNSPGDVIPYDRWSWLEYCICAGADHITIEMSGSAAGQYNAWYDENMNYIGRIFNNILQTGTHTFTVPEGATFFSISNNVNEAAHYVSITPYA